MTRKLSSARGFNLRKEYIRFLKTLSSCENYFDILDAPYYGKTNDRGDIVYVSEKYLSSLSTKGEDPVYALNFVADAYRDFRKYFLKQINSGIVRDDALREVINPIKGWQSMHILYANNIELLYYTLINDYLQNSRFGTNAFPRNFDEFMNSLKELFAYAGREVKLSRSSFILSRRCPISTSGLVLELAPENNSGKMKTKLNTFFKSKNYDFYIRSLKKFGFMADLNDPSRIIADIGSTAMQGYMDRYGITTDNLFDNYYYKAEEYDYDLVKIYLTQFYNNYVRDYPVKTVVKKAASVRSRKYTTELIKNISTKSIPVPVYRITCEKMLKEIVRKQSLTSEQIQELYNDTYWIAFYPEMLNYELGSPLNKNKLSKIIKNSQDVHKNIDISTAKRYTNGIFKTLRFPVNQELETTEQTQTVAPSQTTEPSDSYTNGSSTNGGSTSGGSSGGSSGGGY